MVWTDDEFRNGNYEGKLLNDADVGLCDDYARQMFNAGGFLFGLPLLLLVMGAGIAWVGAGFRPRTSSRNSAPP